MMLVIKIKRHRDANSGRLFRAVYFGREYVRSFWHLSQAMDCAKYLAQLSGAELHKAEIITLRKIGGAA